MSCSSQASTPWASHWHALTMPP
uniref:Uncharacterized protein n=1 Tax=Arundo donax TaxID=35708 RepID=A0A0A8YIM8_ARUDO